MELPSGAVLNVLYCEFMENDSKEGGVGMFEGLFVDEVVSGFRWSEDWDDL